MRDSTVKITITAVDGATKVFQGVGDTAVRQANRAAAAFQKVNDVTNVAIESTGKLGRTVGNAAAQQDRLTASTRRGYLAQTALTTVLSASVNQAFLQMIDVTGQAIQRVDLLANFPKSMEALGLSAQDASASLATLSKYIGQIGGNLQEATTSVARFAEVTKNVKAATSIFVGLNNALIAGGAGEQVRASALEQFTQAFSRGIPQLIEFRSLMVAMPAQLNAVAQALKFKNAQALGEALTQGKVSMKDFVVELTKLSTGTGPIAQQALARMNGIQFAFNVFKNTLVEGMTAIIQTIGRQNIIDFFSVLTGVVRQLAVWAVQLISILLNLFNIVSRVFGGPQLKLAKDKTEGIADNLAAGAGNAGDLADGLDDASDAAKKTANQLASFDKMNVLTEPKDAKDKSKAGAPFSASDLAGLESIFGGIDGKIADITNTAKILAGILASIAGIKLAEGLLNQFNGLAKTMKETAANIQGIKDKLKGTDEKKGLFQKASDSAKGLIATLANVGGAIVAVFANNKATKAVAKFGKSFIGPIAAAASGALALIGSIVVETLIAAGVLTGAVTIPLLGLVAIGATVVAAIVALIWVIWKNWETIINAIKLAAQLAWDFLVAGWNLLVGAITAVWNLLYDVLAAPIKWFLDLFEGIFIALVAIVAIFIQAVVGLFVFLVKGIFDIMKTIGGWIFDNVVTPIVNFFQGMWDAIVGVFTVALRLIFDNILLPMATWIFTNVITPIFNFFKGLWDGVINMVSGLFSGIKNILSPLGSWIYNNVIVPIGNFFSGLWDGIKNGLSLMISALKNLFSGIGEIFKTPLNGIIELINKVIRGVNKLKVPDWVPGGLGGKSPGIQEIPKLARGGIVQESTFAQLGENGKEAIVPLENNLEWLDKLAAKINSTTGSSGQPIHLTIQIGEDKVASKIIDLINEKTQMSGRNAILV